MASVSSFNSISVLSEDLMHCPNCGRKFQDPKLLPCLHSFCQECLETCLSKAQIGAEECFYCPLCKSRCSVPKGGVASMKKNLLVQSMEAFLSFRNDVLNEENVPCGGCGRQGLIKAKAVKCVECDEWLCRECVQSHRSVKVSKKHHLLTSEELLSGEWDDLIKDNMATNFCQRHSLRHRSFCNDCDQLVCEMCQNTTHHSHFFTPISIQAAKESASIQAYLPLVDKSIHNLKHRISNMKKQQKQLLFFRKTFHKEFGDRVAAVIERLTHKLQNYANLLHTVVEELTTDHIDKLNKHNIEKLTGQLEAAKSALTFACHVLDYNMPTSTIPMSDVLTEQLSIFKKAPPTHVPRLRPFRLSKQQKLSIELIQDMVGNIQLDDKQRNDNSLINFSTKTLTDRNPCVISDLAIDHARSSLVLVDEANKNIKEFTFDGQLQTCSPEGFFKAPIRLVVLRNARDLLVNDENTLKRCDKVFKTIQHFSKHKFTQPVGMSQSSNGEILVAEWMSGQILGFDEVGTLVRMFSCLSRNPAYLSCCFSSDHVIVSDWKSHSVKTLHWNGTRISSFGKWGKVKNGRVDGRKKKEEEEKQEDGNDQVLDHPHAVRSDAEDNILVCDSWNDRVVMLDWKGRFKGTIFDRTNNALSCPQAVDVTRQHCFVAERHGLVKVFEYTFATDPPH